VAGKGYFVGKWENEEVIAEIIDLEEPIPIGYPAQPGLICHSVPICPSLCTCPQIRNSAENCTGLTGTVNYS
jgi:hypothetical protein